MLLLGFGFAGPALRCVAYWPDEVPRIFRADGHGPVHLLLTSASDIGFASDGEEWGWIRAALPPLGRLSGKHFQGLAAQSLCSVSG